MEHAFDLVHPEFSEEVVHLDTLLPLIGPPLEGSTLGLLGLMLTEVVLDLTHSWVFGIGKLVPADETLHVEVPTL